MKDEASKVMPRMQVDDFISKPAKIEHIKRVLLKHVGGTKRLVEKNVDHTVTGSSDSD